VVSFTLRPLYPRGNRPRYPLDRRLGGPRIRDSSVGLATSTTARVRFPVEASFCLLHVVQTGSGAHPVSYPMGTVGSFAGSKAAWGVKLTTHLHLVSWSRMMELYLHSPIRFHGIVLNSLSTGITLPGWAPATVWTLWRREKSLDPAGNRNPGRPARSLSLYRLSESERPSGPSLSVLL
jgi:hypothetical protein